MVNAFGKLFLCALLSLPGLSQSQDTAGVTSFELIRQLQVTGTSITSDYLGNVYAINDNEIAKYSSTGSLISSFSDKNAGTITSVDASNPLRVQVFYQDFGQIIYLDDVLSVIGSRISLLEQGLDQATLSCSSWDDGIWLYDPQDFELKRLGNDLRLSHQSGNVNQLVGIEANPNFIIEKNNFVYLNNPLTGILVFDQFGTYYKTLPVIGIERFQVSADQVFYLQEGKLISYNMRMFQYADVPVASDDDVILDLRFERELKQLVILKEKKLEWYVIKD
jgi:hypothetical protein